ncbi:hypothetical protein NOR51B_2525 [Luminiphilus syltensis NOR5-1B]|uniref:Uncharacterized protein n=2 Tax=Luminiphilus TaxID=1341118 RepID=B8KSG8_9GAMM|nr:hypothetical protein NOR51B_2525 [Luminiphilus syltensis NOR5-1B]
MTRGLHHINKEVLLIMTKHALALAMAMGISAGLPLANAQPMEQDIETTTLWEVDMRGKPPYARKRIEVPVVDTARLEIADENAETVRVWTIDRSGKPPFKRRFEELPVSEVSAMSVEAAEAAEPVQFRGRPPFNRHR